MASDDADADRFDCLCGVDDTFCVAVMNGDACRSAPFSLNSSSRRLSRRACASCALLVADRDSIKADLVEKGVDVCP